MDKYTAGKIEGMLVAVRHSVEYVISEELRRASPPEKQFSRMRRLGTVLAELIDLSRELYEEHPELNPHLDAENVTAELRRKGWLPTRE